MLVLLAEGRATTFTDLVDMLGAGPDLVRQMLDHLARAGYVRVLDGCCSGTCAGCGTKSACSALLGARAWALTDRGRRLAGEYRAGDHASSLPGATDRRTNPLQ
jgi:hypothetical protein